MNTSHHESAHHESACPARATAGPKVPTPACRQAGSGALAVRAVNRLPPDGDLQPLRVAVRDERGLPGVVVVREAVRQVVDGIVVPEPRVVVRRRGLVVQARCRPLRLRQVRDVPVERGTVARVVGQHARAPENVGCRCGDADRLRVLGEVVRVHPPARNVGSLPGAMMRYGAWDWASTLNSCGTSLMNFWKVTARSSWNVARSSPTETSYPSCACRRMASLMPNASTREVL